ncbi:MAG: esterase-like activity of phytase family protein [Chloroflexota bacterium]
MVARSGIRNNLAFESLAFTPDGEYLLTGVENALLQDGPIADVDQPSLSRLIKFNRAAGQSVQEMVYPTGPAVAPVTPDIPHGLVDMAALDNNGSLLMLERGHFCGTGLTVRLYQAQTRYTGCGADRQSDVGSAKGIPYEIDPPVTKELLLDLADLGLPFVNNYEGMALGPVLPDGRQTLILVKVITIFRCCRPSLLLWP